ncbi:hypothetical protein N2152v2_006730 [Parachlorella kessleri]
MFGRQAGNAEGIGSLFAELSGRLAEAQHASATSAQQGRCSGVVAQVPAAVYERLATWDKFAAAIKAQFGGINPADKAREGLAHLKQTGTVAKYISQFDSYCLQIPQQDMTDPEVKQRFMDGLKPDIAYRVRLQFPKSCREAMALAEQVDLVQPVVASSSASSAASPPSQLEQGPEPMELCAMKLLHKYGRRQGARYDWPPLTDVQKDYIRKHEGCTYCRRCYCGHTVADCPDKLNNQKRRVHMDMG